MNERNSPEHWLPVPGYEGLYEVSDRGRVRSLPRLTASGRLGGRVLRPRIVDGYLRVNLSKDGVAQSRKIHQLVAEAFLGPCPPGLEIRHLDGNSKNNAIWNLAYDTRSENMLDKVRHGTHHEARKTSCKWGHEFTPDNAYISPSGRRNCRKCRDAKRKGGTGVPCERGCGRVAVAKGLCRMHYNQQWRANRQ